MSVGLNPNSFLGTNIRWILNLCKELSTFFWFRNNKGDRSDTSQNAIALYKNLN
ncbi:MULTISPECIES: hypothetical protein [Nostocales]|uniref:Transposase n=1 Tax=Tolypothrix campylonemoides VB511288_2 TaxID=3232311 RepID=A0ABW8XNI5_9CYAN